MHGLPSEGVLPNLFCGNCTNMKYLELVVKGDCIFSYKIKLIKCVPANPNYQ